MSMSTGMSEQARERLSRLVDGEGAPDELQQLLAAGRESPETWSETLGTWHLYQLVGDVMRSDELAGRGRDDVFLARLRERLADEPVVMAPVALPRDDAQPQPLQAAAGSGGSSARAVPWRRWRAPLAAAAGVMVVAGVAMMTGLPGGPGGSASSPLMLTQAPAAGVPASSVAGPRLLTANGPLLRDARLDQYLSAHQQFGGSSALGVPSGFLRSATYEGPSH